MATADALLTIFIAFLCALLSEGISYVLVYRTERYKTLKASIEKQSKKVEKHKDGDMGASANKRKRHDKEEQLLKQMHQQMAAVRFTSMIVLGITFVSLMSMFNSIFEGHPVAQLPFEPISFFRGITQRGLDASCVRCCSFTFLYILASTVCRQNLKKVLGFDLPSGIASAVNSSFGPAT